MSLDYNIINVPEKFKTDGLEWTKTEALIWMTLLIGIREITEENWKVFAARVAFYERVHGTHLKKNARPLPFKAEWVRQRIGLRTNASSMTEAHFIKHHGGLLLRDITRSIEEATKPKIKAA